MKSVNTIKVMNEEQKIKDLMKADKSHNYLFYKKAYSFVENYILRKIKSIDIKEVDIWNYLIETKWCKGHDLMLSDIVNDILKTNNEKIDSYLKEKLNKDRTQYFDNNLEIL